MDRLPNYLRSHRKRLALSQEEVAFLLGAQNGANVSRHEQFAREPSLATALAYEVVLQKPVSELFAGLYQKIQQDVAVRAKTLAHRIDREKPSSRTALRRQFITSIASKSLN
jgi:DNA-binding XRE family transcriptional regulator